MYHICDFNHVPNIMDAADSSWSAHPWRSNCCRTEPVTCQTCQTCRTWLNFRDQYGFPSGYGSIPINTIFSGMNIHKSQLFWCELQGYQVLTHPHLAKYDVLCFLKNLFLKTNLMNWQIVTSCLNKLIHKANNQNILLLGLIWVCLKIGYLQIWLREIRFFKEKRIMPVKMDTSFYEQDPYVWMTR